MARFILAALFSFHCFSQLFAQCSALRQQRNLSFNTDRDCAPVTVTDFTITYCFNVPQDPNTISIRFQWNDPGNNVDIYGLGDPQFSVGGGDMEFTAAGTFVYPENEDCLFEPTAHILVNGVACETSEQIQLVSSWSNDNDFGGDLLINPDPYAVCFNNPIVNAVLDDNSTFNCNINDEPDNPNRLARHTQFVYGTNHDPSNAIRNLTLENGGTINLTDGSANLSSTTTRNGVTGAYFGPIVEIPFTADGPNMSTFPMNAPADINNAVGSEFEITLYNWNTCNPYNGDPLNPNYNEAVSTTGYIRIVALPNPDFQTRVNDASGNIQTIFCIGEPIYFENLTAGANSYRWEFYADDTDATLASSSTANSPTFTYDVFGDKLIRLIAEDPNAQGACEVIVEKIISLSPSTTATIELYEPTFTTQIEPRFCQSDGSDIFTIGFRDATTNIEPNSEWRWEFYDENGGFVESLPAAGFGPQNTDFTRNYSTPGQYLVRLTARNNASNCQTVDEKTITIYDSPAADFMVNEVCEGERTGFSEIADELSGITPRIDGDYIDSWHWDFSYNGTFRSELIKTDSAAFEWFLDGTDIVAGNEPSISVAGTYQVALRVTTAQGLCSDTFVRDVIVQPSPEPILDSDYSSPICANDSLTIYNNSDLSDGNYFLTISDGTSTDSVSFDRVDTTIVFGNSSGMERTYSMVLHGISNLGCLAKSDSLKITVLPTFPSSFTDINYNPVGSNCSPWESTLQVGESTQSLNPDAYIWSISQQGTLLPGYPVTKNAGDATFHSLDYTIENNSGTNQVYQINLEVVKSGICVDNSQLDVVINPVPSADFEIRERDSCSYKVFELEASQKGLTYYWSFDPEPDQWVNDGDVQLLMYNRPPVGSSNLNTQFSLSTENLVNCMSEELTQSEVVEASEAAILIDFDLVTDTLTLPANNTVDIVNNSNTGMGWEYHWDFGDGNTQDIRDPLIHQYNEPGSYQVTLSISNAFCSEILSKSIIVNPSDPVVDFIADPRTGCRPLVVSFTDLSENTDRNTYRWDFGDGITSAEVSPQHTYSKAGTYTVTLYAENTTGGSDTETKEFYIEVLPTPIADFIANPTTVLIPDQEVFFRNLSINADRYEWDFGDGSTSIEENPIHTYGQEGKYGVSLIAQNALGCADTLAYEGLIAATKGGTVKIPNAFSPSPEVSESGGNNNSINDVFLPRVEGAQTFKMLIYNKWGELLFESDNQQTGWNGYYKGRLMPTDVYVYRLEIIFSDGREAIRIGDVTLVR
ncbi:MAG: PKD domain-containing protein [Cyclobacteriaceae bacterium]